MKEGFYYYYEEIRLLCWHLCGRG